MVNISFPMAIPVIDTRDIVPIPDIIPVVNLIALVLWYFV